MKILVKDRKWNMLIGNMVLVCDVKESNGVFNIEFMYNGKKISLKSNNIDQTLKYLEQLFLMKQNPNNNNNNNTQKSA